MNHSSPRANFGSTAGSAFRMNLGIRGIIAKYPVQIEESEGVITIRHTCSSRFSLAVTSQNDETDDIEVDWGDGTVTQETPYVGLNFPTQEAGEAAAWHHTYADATPRTITITPISNTQIKSFSIQPMAFSYVGGVGEEFYEILNVNLSDAPALERFRISKQPNLTEIDMSNSIQIKDYYATDCENLTSVLFTSGGMQNPYEVYLTNTGITSLNLPSISKVTGIRVERSDNLTEVDLSSENNYILTSFGSWDCPNLTSIVFGDISMLNSVSVGNCNLSTSTINNILTKLVYQCENPQPNPEEVASLEQDIVRLEADIDALNDDLTQAQSELSNLQTILSGLQDELALLIEDSPEWIAKYDEILEIETQIESKNAEIYNIESDIASTEDALEYAQEQLQGLYDDLEPIQGSFNFSNNPGAEFCNQTDVNTLRDTYGWDIDDGFGSGGE